MDQFAQQRRDLHDLACCRQIGARQWINKQSAGGDMSGNTQGMPRSFRQPDAASGRNNPTPRCSIDPHHAAQAVQQLRAVVLMPRFTVAMSIVMGEGNERTMREGER